jgi:hypothetical protein
LPRRTTISATLATLLLLAACSSLVDADGDGYRGELDCDDQRADRHPGADEVCNGLDDDCDPQTWAADEGWDIDADGAPDCIDCDDEAPNRYPGAEAFCESIDADCDGEPDGSGAEAGSSASCPALDCADVLARHPGAADGSYFINAGSARAFEVSCDMSTEGGGWIQLQLDDNDGVIVASSTLANPWLKCDDDAARFYQGLSEDEISEDRVAAGHSAQEAALRYRNPDTGEVLGDAETGALRRHISELHPQSRMVATIGDNDGGNWQEGGGGGLEVYIALADGRWRLLTPGSGGDCGGGSWPSAGSETGFYLWSSDPARSDVAGDTSLTSADWQLERGEILPTAVHMMVFTGGGVSFGFEQQTFAVR